MAKKIIFYLFILFGACLLASFERQIGMVTVISEGKNPYEGCCGAEPVIYMTTTSKIFIPNVFTPNDDGINDLFYPVVEGEMNTILNFAIQSSETGSVLFQKESFEPFSPSLVDELAPDGWDGKILDGEVFKGPFKYRMSILDMGGEIVEIEGMACSVVCDSDAVILQENPNCFYPVQVGQDGGLDASLPNFEKKCFSN